MTDLGTRRYHEVSIAALSPYLVLTALAAAVAVMAAWRAKYWTVPGILAGALAAWSIGSWPQTFQRLVLDLTMLLTRHAPPNLIIERGYWFVTYASFAQLFLVGAGATEIVLLVAQGVRLRGRGQLSHAK